MDEEVLALRHSASHIMAQAVSHIFKDVKFGIGPPIEDGFYYDFDLPRTLTPDDLPLIEEEMRRIVEKDEPFIREEIPKEKAREIFKDQPYKLELLDEIEDEVVSIYRQGDFVDLCKGPHVSSTGKVKNFKLLKIAGAYWRGDERRKMLQRIYGVAFKTKEELDEYLERLKEAEKRDHRRKGKELELFSIEEEIGPGLVLWHPKGALVRMLIEDFWKREHIKRGYKLVYTPHIAKISLWERSGHLEFYRENMFPPMNVEGQEYILKPMNCPAHIFIYKSRTRSYRELPLRLCELGTVYRYERSGVLHGLARVRGFTQDDAHIFLRPDQLEDEIREVLKLAMFMLRTFGFSEFEIYLSTRPERYAGTLDKWEMATNALRKALEMEELPYKIDPGEGVFYGPKIDIALKDALGREWQGPTIQVDFNFPERFDINFINRDGREERVVMIHRTVLGSMERFMACLLEHHKGALPVWLSPTQVIIIPIADRHIPYSDKIREELEGKGIRVEVDGRKERMTKKIRDAEVQKIPFMIIIGDEEVEGGNITVRTREGENIKGIPLEKFEEMIEKEVRL